MDTTLLLVLVALAAIAAVLLLVLLLRPRSDPALRERLDALRGDSERVERVLREEQRAARTELADTLDRLGGQIRERLGGLTADNEKRLNEVRATLDTQLKALQSDNAMQLDKMRTTVDEKLQSTLNARLGESFGVIAKQLEAVQRGLGEMQALATGVGDLKRVLSNVKTRGTFGEVRLGALLEQVLTAEQYAANVATIPGSDERVEYAIRLPGADRDAQVWLPIDAKFPVEDYQRLLDAQEAADGDAANAAAVALQRRVEAEAKTIHEKYVAPPHTTDFALLFLPTEGLYAEVIRRPGLFEKIQRDHHVTLAGPTTLAAILNALQMGFRTLAIEQRSSEVWQILGAVKTEFGKFGMVLEKTRKQLDAARNTIDSAGVRTRAIERKLRGVEELPTSDSQALLGDLSADTDDDDGSESTDTGEA
ncbi:MAG TPA: DNA recombination protein RmuC [Rhodanobacteraceae bacterium]|nr:DNA recombination protein RmuC [Rhodanobacteraceae bacterium]